MTPNDIAKLYTKQQLERLDTVKLAKKHNCDASVISDAQYVLGCSNIFRCISKKDLLTLTNEDIMDKYDCSIKKACSERKRQKIKSKSRAQVIPKYMLRTYSNKDLAFLCNCSISKVISERKRTGIRSR